MTPTSATTVILLTLTLVTNLKATVVGDPDHIRHQQQQPPLNYQRESVSNYQRESVPNYQRDSVPNYQRESVPNYQRESVPNYQRESVLNYSKKPVINYSKKTASNYSIETEPNYPKEPAVNYPKETTVNYSKQPVPNYPKETDPNYRKEPAVNYPKEPALNYPKEPALNYTKEPALNYPKEPALNYPKEPALNYPKEPALNYPKEPALNYPKEPALNYPKEPALNYPKEPALNYPKERALNYSKDPVPNYPKETAINYSKESLANEPKEVTKNSQEAVTLAPERITESQEVMTGTELPVISSCLGCAEKKKKMEERVSAAELKKLKIKMIKNQILSKLNLRSRPKARVSRSELPDILLRAEVLGQKVVKTTSPLNDQIEATEKILIFPNNFDTNYSCWNEMGNCGSLCFNFQIPARSLTGGIESGDLFFYKNAPLKSTNQNLIINEIIWTGVNGTGSKKERFLLRDEEPSRQGWLKFDMNSTLRKWAEKPHLQHSFQMTCKGKGCPGLVLPISLDDKRKPFLVISTGPLQTVSRKRRETVCTEGSSRCCKESLTITFEEIGWGDWIIHPLNFTANYCRGTCESELDISRYHHTSVMQRYLTSLRARNVQLDMSLCCSPSRMSSMSIIYMGQDNEVKMSELNNMIVQACECA